MEFDDRATHERKWSVHDGLPSSSLAQSMLNSIIHDLQAVMDYLQTHKAVLEKKNLSRLLCCHEWQCIQKAVGLKPVTIRRWEAPEWNELPRDNLDRDMDFNAWQDIYNQYETAKTFFTEQKETETWKPEVVKDIYESEEWCRILNILLISPENIG